MRATVTDRVRPDSLLDRLRSRFPHTLQVFHEPEGAVDRGRVGSTVSSERDPHELGEDFLAYVTRGRPSAGEVGVFAAGYDAALAALRAEEVA